MRKLVKEVKQYTLTRETKKFEGRVNGWKDGWDFCLRKRGEFLQWFYRKTNL